MRMIQENLCRSLPSDTWQDTQDDDDEEGCFAEPSWPHLSIVYETLLRVVQSNEIDLSIKKKYIDSRYVLIIIIFMFLHCPTLFFIEFFFTQPYCSF
jgi:hypothetical protein